MKRITTLITIATAFLLMGCSQITAAPTQKTVEVVTAPGVGPVQKPQCVMMNEAWWIKPTDKHIEFKSTISAEAAEQIQGLYTDRCMSWKDLEKMPTDRLNIWADTMFWYVPKDKRPRGLEMAAAVWWTTFFESPPDMPEHFSIEKIQELYGVPAGETN